jgi:hypothetical protein
MLLQASEFSEETRVKCSYLLDIEVTLTRSNDLACQHMLHASCFLSLLPVIAPHDSPSMPFLLVLIFHELGNSFFFVAFDYNCPSLDQLLRNLIVATECNLLPIVNNRMSYRSYRFSSRKHAPLSWNSSSGSLILVPALSSQAGGYLRRWFVMVLQAVLIPLRSSDYSPVSNLHISADTHLFRELIVVTLFPGMMKRWQ